MGRADTAHFTPPSEDIAADISEAVLTKISTLRKPVAFEAWFWAITRNQVRAWLRHKQRDSTHTEPKLPDPIPPDEAVVVGEEHLAIRSALARLSETDRHLLWLREIEGLSYQDISSKFDVATGAMRVRCHRARRRLQAAYEDVSKHGKPPDETANP